MKKIMLNMLFDNDNMPELGSIQFDKYTENLHLLGVDVDKLNTVLTRTVCVNTYNVDVFPFQSGDIAFADDTGRIFIYNSVSDRWHEWEI